MHRRHTPARIAPTSKLPYPRPHGPAAGGVVLLGSPAAARSVAVPSYLRGASMIQRTKPAGQVVVTKLHSTKLFVLDTNVLMYDPTSLFRFDEHDVFLPMITLEELDDHKKGMSEVARNARQTSRYLEEIIARAPDGDLGAGISLSDAGIKQGTGNLLLQTEAFDATLPSSIPSSGKADNQILAVVKALQERNPRRQVILVSKDINMRIKARALALAAEDYFNDKVLEDTDLLYTGVRELPADFWEQHGKEMESWQQAGSTFYRVRGPLCQSFAVNEFVWLEADRPFHAIVKEQSGKTAILQTIKEYSHQKNSVWGIVARNREQNFALNLLMNPECDFVTLLGQAGTGKTL
ncbi:MAG: PhoH family protein, partial [Proteobacteria bacterium]|nr:PhoH family protein [Burkholderiales bacterium]